MSLVDGWDCKLYYGTAGDQATTLLDNVKDGTLSLGAAEADVSVRGTAFDLTAVVRHAVSFSFDLLYVFGDTGFAALETAYKTRAAIALLIADGAKMTPGVRGVDGDFVVTQFDRNEPLDGKITYSVTVKPTKTFVTGTTRNPTFFLAT